MTIVNLLILLDKVLNELKKKQNMNKAENNLI